MCATSRPTAYHPCLRYLQSIDTMILLMTYHRHQAADLEIVLIKIQVQLVKVSFVKSGK